MVVGFNDAISRMQQKCALVTVYDIPKVKIFVIGETQKYADHLHLQIYSSDS